MHYLKFGDSKKYLVCLHGWGADLNSFLFLKDYFDDYTKLFVDFAGFGKTPEPPCAYNVLDYVKDLEGLLDNFEIEKLALVGHSFGGRVAVKFAATTSKYKNLKLCLVDAAGIKPRLSLAKKWKIFRYKCLKRKVQKTSKYSEKLRKFGSNDYKMLSPIMKQTFVNVVNDDLSSLAKTIKFDTIIVWGKQDKETKLYMAKKYHRLIKNSKLYILQNAGHFSFLDEKQEFLIILDSFLKN